eukprot:3272031-Lingulodinium_polyedra.AAC.1
MSRKDTVTSSSSSAAAAAGGANVCDALSGVISACSLTRRKSPSATRNNASGAWRSSAMQGRRWSCGGTHRSARKA